MKRLLAGALTALIAGLLLWTGGRHQPAPGSTSPAVPAPGRELPALAAEDFLRNTLDAARKGDVSTYLAAFGGALRQRLQQDVKQRGEAAFAADLRQAARARKGHALYAPEPDGPGAYRIMVESVYADRNERQAYRLEQAAGNWQITAVDPARGHTPSTRYGEPADYQPPQDIPVPTQEASSESRSHQEQAGPPGISPADPPHRP